MVIEKNFKLQITIFHPPNTHKKINGLPSQELVSNNRHGVD